METDGVRQVSDDEMTKVKIECDSCCVLES